MVRRCALEAWLDKACKPDCNVFGDTSDDRGEDGHSHLLSGATTQHHLNPNEAPASHSHLMLLLLAVILFYI